MDDSNPLPKRLRSKQKRNQKAAASSPAPSSLSNEDLEALKSFCDLVNYEEISFESWQQKHSSLDLHVPIWVNSELARDGGEALVSYSRTIKGQESGSKPVRQPISIKLQIPSGTREGSHLKIVGNGDQDAEKVGNLIVIIHLKSS